MAKFELSRSNIFEVSVQNAKGVKVCDVVSAYLVCSDEQLDLSDVGKQNLVKTQADCLP
jgi:hypothetical protein